MKEPPTDAEVDAKIERARLCLKACEGLPDSALQPGSVAKLVRAARIFECQGPPSDSAVQTALKVALWPFNELV